MRVVDIFAEQCRLCPHKLALLILPAPSAGKCLDNVRREARAFTWAQLEQLVLQTAARMQEAGRLNSGDHIASWLPNGLAWILVDLASQWMGWVHVALDARLPMAMATDLIDRSQSRLLIVPDNVVVRFTNQVDTVSATTLESFCDIDSHPAQWQSISSTVVAENAPAQMLYTSGTVSRPKGVLLSHRNLLSNAQAKLGAAPQFGSDVRLNILPFAHAYARTCELSTWILSGSQLCIASDWDAFLHWAPIVQPTLANLVPHLVYRVADLLHRDDPNGAPLGKRLRLLQVGGAALRADVWQRLAARGWPPLQGYGLTETSPVICSNRAGQQRCDTVGPPVDGVDIRIDASGVLWTRGAHVMLGYWQDEAATAQRLRDGWFCTGDLAEQMDDGSLRIIGRVDDQVTLSTGYKVAPLELTRRLADEPWVEHMVLVGQDRPFIAALVWPRNELLPEGITQSALVQMILQHWQARTGDLPRFMQIERLAIVTEPLTVENGGLNFKGAVRRKFVEQTLCRREVESIYEM